MDLWSTGTMYHVVKHRQKIGHAPLLSVTKSDAAAQNVFCIKHFLKTETTNV